MQNREVKFGQILGSLIEAHGHDRNRKQILGPLNISASALSQYIRDQARPSFDKLLAMAEFFDVSLDYLVDGAPSEGGGASREEPLLRFIDQALSEVQARSSRHSAVVARIGRVLADRVDDVAAELAAAPTAAGEGLVQDDEALRLEGYCLRADILSLDLGLHVVQVGSYSAASRFLNVVARNLQAGSKYRFIIPGEEYVPEGAVSAFRSLLTRQVTTDQVHRNCAFRRTSAPVMLGIALYQLDVTALARDEPALHAQLSPDVDEDNWLGYAIRPYADSNSDMLLDSWHLCHAKNAFENLWASSESYSQIPDLSGLITTTRSSALTLE